MHTGGCKACCKGLDVAIPPRSRARRVVQARGVIASDIIFLVCIVILYQNAMLDINFVSSFMFYLSGKNEVLTRINLTFKVFS